MAQAFAPAAISLADIPAPDVIEALDFERLFSHFQERFKVFWADARQQDPSLPQYDVEALETDPAMVVGQAFAYIRLLDRQRVNDAIKALLAPLASGSDLDNLVAGRNLQRLVMRVETPDAPALFETDAQLLRRYLLSFDVPASGSAGRYLFDAYSAWPDMGHGRVNGHLVHGRRGDTDVVITGLDGALPSDAALSSVRSSVRHEHRAPEACAISVRAAGHASYRPDLLIKVPGIGPSPNVVRNEALARVIKAGLARALVGGQIPAGLLVGAAYGENVIEVIDRNPIVVPPDPYKVPVLLDPVISIEVVT